MNKRNRLSLFGIACLFSLLPVWALWTNASEIRRPVVIEGRQTLPLRVLARPMSHIRAEPDNDAQIVQENVPTFQPLVVYTRPPVDDFGTLERWYEVGSDVRGTILGWMRADDVMEWRQTMCLAFRHPEGRHPVLMFERRGPLAELVMTDPAQRSAEVARLIETVNAGEIPEGFPLISMEPEGAVDLLNEDQFYLLPIFRHEPVEINSLDGDRMVTREGRILQLAAATRTGRGEQPTPDPDLIPDSVKDLTIDLVYVIDTTASMQPYIDGTRNAIQRVSERIAANEAIADTIRFGLWTFRDSLTIPGIEYLTRNHTESLVSASELADLMEHVEEAKVGSQGFPEDVFSGVFKALTETDWNPDALRMIVLIGDAPSHPKGHPWNYSGLGAEELRQLADDKRITIKSVHIREMEDERALPYHEIAEPQFRTLAMNRGSQGMSDAMYTTVSAQDEEAFDRISDRILHYVETTLQAAHVDGDISVIARGKPVSDHRTYPVIVEDEELSPAGEEQTPSEDDALDEMLGRMMHAALVDWIGRAEGVQAPRDIVAWVVDKDLKDPAIPSLDVRVLISKNQLDSLREVLQEIRLAGYRGQITGSSFFDALQATSATMTISPEHIRNARTLADTGLIPEFLMDLPYQSRIMNMTSDDWNSWSQDQQDDFLIDLDAKIRYYDIAHNSPNLWIRLNPGDDPDAHVYPISLMQLP